jgi:hypothetical protein
VIAAAAALLTIVFAPGRVLAEKAPRVGVVVSVQVNLKRSEAQGLSGALGRALHQRLVVDVIAGTEASRRLPAEGVSESCAVDEVCIRDVAQRLTADEILFLVAVRVGNRIQVDSTWVDPANGRNVSRPKVVMVKLDEAEARFADAASLILPDAVVRSEAAASDANGGNGGGAQIYVVRSTPRRMTVPAWISAGVTAAALGTAIGFGIGAAHDHGRCQDLDGTDERCTDAQLDNIDRKARVADIAAIATGVGLVTTGLIVWFSGGDIERVPVTQALRFSVDPGGGAFVTWGGSL